MLEQIFKLTAHGTTVRREVVAGLTTFFTMAYIIFVNPAMLAEAGMDKGAVFASHRLDDSEAKWLTPCDRMHGRTRFTHQDVALRFVDFADFSKLAG